MIVVAGYMGYVALKVEIHSVIMIGFIFFIYLFFIKHNAYYAVCSFRKNGEKVSDTLKWYINNSRLTIADKTKSSLSFDNFVKDVSKKLRNDNYASVAAGIFPTLGILGTFISIAISMPDFSSKDSAQLEREISLLLGGVGTAFYVSIYGIFLSLWWIFFEKSGLSSFDKEIRAMRESVSHHFWSKDEIDLIHAKESIENYKNLNRLISKITADDFMSDIEKRLEKRLSLFDQIISREQNSFEAISKHFTDMDRFAESGEDISFRMREFSTKIEESNKLLTHLNHKLTQKDSDLNDITNNLSLKIEELNQSLKNISSENVKELYGAVVQNIEIMRSESAKVGYAFNKNLDDFDEKYSEKLRLSLELIDSQTAKIIKQLAQLR
jgi:methyl-accepting chemotaxis protein